jgi:hypothetical protein
MTFHEAVALAQADHAAKVGAVLTVDFLVGYIGDTDVQTEHYGPTQVRVLPTATEDLKHSVDDWLDPYWDVEVLDASLNLRSAWIYGPSYQFARE